MLEPDDHFLLGTDLVKDVDRLEAAYDDARGVTAEFNKNVLHVMNRELDADFDLDAFEHVAVLGPRRGVDRDAPALDARPDRARRAPSTSTCAFAAGEEMRTEVSAKFRREGIDGRAARGRARARRVVDRSRRRLRALPLLAAAATAPASVSRVGLAAGSGRRSSRPSGTSSTRTTSPSTSMPR